MSSKIIQSVFLIFISLLACKNEERNTDNLEIISEVTNIGKSIDQYLKAMEALGFSGAITVGISGQKILSKGYGFANREKQIPFTPQTVQSNGSNTKQFTGAAILLLESRGHLSVKDSLPRYFENVPTDKQPITLHQLLTHSSGLLQGVGHDEEPIKFDPFFKRLMAEPLEFKPGSSYNYSNAGYSLLAKIVENISGMKYETFLQQNLLEPLGMQKTGYVLPEWHRENMAIGYKKGEQWGEVYENGWIKDGPSWHLRGNGGLHTTAEDMYKWMSTLRGGGALDKKAVEKWTTGYITENNGYSKYGYGLVSWHHDQWGKVITHNGSNGIFTSEFFWLPERAFFFYIHGNNSIIPAYSLEKDILAAAFDKEFLFPPIIEVNKSIDKQNVKKKQGTYEHQGGSIQLMSDDTRLIGKISGQGALDLMFKNNASQKEKFASLNATVKRAMIKLETGDETAFKEMVKNDEVSQEVFSAFQNRIIQMERSLESLHVIGSFENPSGSQFHGYGPYTTFVHARFENWNQYWNLVWNEDGTHHGNYSGPWPEFTLLPVGGERYVGIRGTSPWQSIDVEFLADDLMIENERFIKVEI